METLSKFNIHKCSHIYKEANKVANCLAKKGIGSIYSNVWWSNFPRDVIKIGFEDYCGYLFNRVCKIYRP